MTPRRCVKVPEAFPAGSSRWRGVSPKAPPFARASRTVAGLRGAACDWTDDARSGRRLVRVEASLRPRTKRQDSSVVAASIP
jgi:hypothetical protein